MNYCNDCFAVMDAASKHCKACQSRDIRTFQTTSVNQPSQGVPKDLDSKVSDWVDRPQPSKTEDTPQDPKSFIEPLADANLKEILSFDSDPKLAKAAKKYSNRIAKAQRKSRKAAMGKARARTKNSLMANFALVGPLAILLVLGTFVYGFVADLVRSGQEEAKAREIAWAQAQEIPERLLPAVEVETKGSFEWLGETETPGGYWDPCRTIYWVVNPENEPEGARKLMAEAFAQIESRTGLNFEFFGETYETYSAKRSPVNSAYPKFDSSWSPVVINYLSGELFDKAVVASGNGGEENVAAFAGPDSAFDKNSKAVYVSGTVTISADWFEKSMIDWGKPGTRAVFLHELGHLVGLGHVKEPQEIMYAENNGQEQLGPGDKRGLALAGQSTCLAPFEYPIPEWTDWSSYD